VNIRNSSAIVVLSLLVILSVIVIASPTGYSHEKNGQLVKVMAFEGGTAFRTGDNIYWVLSLRGTWREMGRQYGGLVREDLRRFYGEITEDVAARGIDKRRQLEEAKAFAAGFNDNLRELLQGISETSGLSEEEVLLLNAGMLNLADAVLGPVAPSACSGLAAWGSYTPDGSMVFGRNWDIDRESMKKYMKYLSVVVFNPASGNGFANVHPLGNVYLETGMNSKGLFLELNNGVYSDTNIFEERENTASSLVTALNQCSTIAGAAAYLAAVPADMAYMIQIADSQECVSLERPTFASRVRRSEQNGVLAAYNSFVPPYPQEWRDKVAKPRDPKEDPRYQNLLRLANSKEFYGKLDPAGMKKLLDVQMQNGGATHKGSVLQVIAVPKDLRLWIRGLDYSGWQEIDLKELFKNN
jgi:hypothetical protein